MIDMIMGLDAELFVGIAIGLLVGILVLWLNLSRND